MEATFSSATSAEFQYVIFQKIELFIVSVTGFEVSEAVIFNSVAFGLLTDPTLRAGLHVFPLSPGYE
jgi:hypothetical protein